jgi:hypothetical protein
MTGLPWLPTAKLNSPASNGQEKIWCLNAKGALAETQLVEVHRNNVIGQQRVAE